MAKKEKEFVYEWNPVKEQVGGKDAERVIWTTKTLNMAVDALSQGLPLKTNPFCGKNTKLLRPDLVYKRTQEELEDYIRCKDDPVYFGEKCYLMTPEGLQKCELRDYQKDYLYHLRDHRFSIMCSCRQAGKTLTFINNINIYIPNNIKNVKIVNKLKDYNYFYINDKQIYNIPLFELWDLFGIHNFKWKIKYHLYKIIYKLNKYAKGKM